MSEYRGRKVLEGISVTGSVHHGLKSIASKWQGPGRRKVAPETATFCDSRTLVSQSSPVGASLTSTASSTHVGTGLCVS